MLKITHPYIDLQKNIFSIDANEPITVETVKVDKKSQSNMLFVYRLKDKHLASRECIGIIKSIGKDPVMFKVKNLTADGNRCIIEMSEKNVSINHLEGITSSMTYINRVSK